MNILILPPDNTWKWNEKVKMKKDPVAWATFMVEAANKQSIWEPTGATTDTELPRMIALPAVVAKYAMERPRMAKEVFDYINKLVAEGFGLGRGDGGFCEDVDDGSWAKRIGYCPGYSGSSHS
jgi:hypothetical protein